MAVQGSGLGKTSVLVLVLVLVLGLAACGPGLKPPDRASAADALTRATTDVAAMTALLREGVVLGGVWFGDPACAAKFTGGQVAKELLPELARCLVTLQLRPSPREDALGDVVVMTYPPGFELEARIEQDLDRDPAMTWIGFASKRASDTLPTISGDALEALRTAGDRDGPLDPAVGDALEREPLSQPTTPNQVIDRGKTFAFTWVKICLDATGAVTEVDPFLTTSSPAEVAFVAAARSWKFRPFLLRDRAIPVCAMSRLSYPPGSREPEVLPLPPPPSRSRKRPLVLATSRLLQGRRISGVTAIAPDDDTKRAIQAAGNPRLQGVFRICIDDAGLVESVLPLRSTGSRSYDTTLIGHMQRWKYSPYEIDDQPVPVCALITFFYTQR